VEVTVGASNFTVGWKTPSYFAGSPIVTGDVVWVVDVDSGKLYGYNIATGAQRFSFSVGGVVHFCTPAAGDGRLFVAGYNAVHSFVLA
jgi:outer membrane protein assembly factor BamB